MTYECIVTIERVADGARAEYRYTSNEPWGEGSDYIWAEGNFGCDCNRANFFADARGEARPNQDALTCSEDKFWVVQIADEAGKVVYTEDRP